MGRASLSPLSPQAAEVYRMLLATDEPTTAKSLGSKLSIFPNSVYRVVKDLEKHGLVERLSGRPVRFRARPAEKAVDGLFLPYREWFLESFSAGKEDRVEERDDLGVSFIHNRDESIERSTEDQKSAKKEVLLIISGDEVPQETILVNKQAMERGVKIKIIAQRVDEENREMLENWQKMGMEIRYSPTIKTRITIIDGRIVYIVSYNPEDYKQGIGVRFNYPPVAHLLREMFMRRWRETKRI